MRVTVEIDGDLREIMRDEVLRGEIAVTAAVGGATRQVKNEMRAQVRSAKLGSRLANSIRERLYPEREASMRAAGLIWSKAPKIIDAFERGVAIRAKLRTWLAIPTAAAMKSVKGGKITPLEWEQRTGLKLRFVYRPGRPALLVADKIRISKRGIAKEARRKNAPAATAVIFTLVPQVKLPKRLDFGPVTQKVLAAFPEAIVANWRG